MTIKEHGKKISEIWLLGEGNACHLRIKTENHQELELSALHHGDRDEFSVIVKQDGRETERINTRMVTSIIWDKQ